MAAGCPENQSPGPSSPGDQAWASHTQILCPDCLSGAQNAPAMVPGLAPFDALRSALSTAGP